MKAEVGQKRGVDHAEGARLICQREVEWYKRLCGRCCRQRACRPRCHSVTRRADAGSGGGEDACRGSAGRWGQQFCRALARGAWGRQRLAARPEIAACSQGTGKRTHLLLVLMRTGDRHFRRHVHARFHPHTKVLTRRPELGSWRQQGLICHAAVGQPSVRTLWLRLLPGCQISLQEVSCIHRGAACC